MYINMSLVFCLRKNFSTVAPSVEAVEYTDIISVEG